MKPADSATMPALMNHLRRVFALALISGLALGAAACGGDSAGPRDAVCAVQADEISEPAFLIPLPGDPDRGFAYEITVTNQVEQYSIHGQKDLTGALTVQFDQLVPHPPFVRVVPVNADTTFDLAPRETKTFRLAVTVNSQTSPGPYTGIIGLGTLCSPVPVSLPAYGRPEPPPDTLAAVDAPPGYRFSHVSGFAASADRILTVDPGTNWALLFNPAQTSVKSLQIPLRDAPLRGPGGVALAPDGSWWIGDLDGEDLGRISRFDPAGEYLNSWGAVPDGHGGTANPLGRPGDLAIDAGGRLFLLDTDGKRVLRCRRDEQDRFTVETTWGGPGTGPGKFQSLGGIACTGDGTVYVSDPDRNLISVFDADGTFLRSFGSAGKGPAQFDHPAGLDLDAAGNLYVADQWNYRVQKLGPDGSFLTAWGFRGKGLNSFQGPEDVALVPGGRVLVSDPFNNRLVVFGSHWP